MRRLDPNRLPRGGSPHPLRRPGRVLLLALVLAAVLAGPAVLHARPPGETEAARDARLGWWRDARFGLFVHWGIYAVPAGTYEGRKIRPDHGGEWIQADAPVPADRYEPYARQFNPVKFDARQWVALVRDAGMRYIVITSKHHDGFCLFDSKATDYDILDRTPYTKDPLAALAKACREGGVRLGFYYSQLDWHHPAQMLDPDRQGQGQYRYTCIRPGRKDEYVAYMKTQLEELITRYDPWVLFFDGEWVKWWTVQDGQALEAFCRRLKPGLVINNRVGKRRPEDGDYGTPEQKIPATGLPYDWETCMTMNRTWGYKTWDDRWKSADDLLRKLVDIASKGGNFLLNVGPKADGTIPEESVTRLRAMGRWLRANGDAIYGTRASPFAQPAWGRYTRKPGRLFAHVLAWPAAGRLTVPVAHATVAKAYLLADASHEPLKTQAAEAGRTAIALPAAAPDPVCSVIALDLKP